MVINQELSNSYAGDTEDKRRNRGLERQNYCEKFCGRTRTVADSLFTVINFKRMIKITTQYHACLFETLQALGTGGAGVRDRSRQFSVT